MRLHSLGLQAFGPFATPQRIDFDRLAAGGLFLLEGPTGAGKTTVLDAITFALYGGLAGEDAGSDRLHSHFADPGVEPSVTLEFSVRGVRYLISRVPEHRRPKRRGQGYTTEAMRVHLRRREAGQWVTMSSNKAETGDAIADIIGLSRTQFTQVMLLPQGEFARFLRCGDDARRAVLTRLFGTELYDKITLELDRRRAVAVKQRQDAKAEIAEAVSAAAEAAGLDAAARGELICLPAGERGVRFKQIGDDLAGALASAGAELERAAGQARAALGAEQAAAARAALMTRLTGALASLHRHEATRPEHDARATRLDAARRAEPVRPLLAALDDAGASAGRARDRLRALVGAAAAADFGCLLGESADSALVRRTAKDSAARAGACLREATGLEHLVAAESTVPGRETAVANLDRAAARAAAHAGSLAAARDELPGRIAAAEARLAAASAAAAGLEASQQRQAALVPLRAAAARLAELEPLLADRAALLRAAVEEHQRLVDDHQGAMEARLAGMAAELAAALGDGAPCPVCGSAQHPAPAAAGVAPVTERAVRAARERRDAAAAARSRAEQEHAELARQAAEQAAVAAGHTLAGLAAEEAEVAERLAAAESAAAKLPAFECELAGLRGEQERLGQDLRAAAAAEATARHEADQARTDLAELNATLAQAAQGHPSVAARRAGLEQAAEGSRQLAAALDELAAALDAAAQARDRAAREGLASGFGTLELARLAVLGPTEQSALGERVASWTRELTALQAAAASPDLAGLDPDLAGQAHASAEQAAAALARAGDAEQNARTAHETQRARAARLSDRLAEVRAAETAAAALDAATGPVIYLAGLAKGMDGHRRVALTTYVLRHWFEQVVAAANVKLAVMSSGRYELRRSDEGESRRQRGGLTLSVVDRHTGQVRSPNSLSGGETFYASLALALGLADVVKAEAGGVDTQTLFIDEGFGSLDAETLDQVLGVIDELRDRGRAVGIVSHVADLRDRVAERLEIRRLPDGSSALRVVA
ncbi:MAG TPA: AAA family ATPase [Streptosporangiaceae bacterium]|nr:AAA family ATPase [Streptosporangiaceae bacterium]